MKKLEKLPYIVLIIDELADIMTSGRGKEVESYIVRLAQMSRAVGIHLILATQRPSVEIITGLIKANITTRIALQVASQIDSRTILDFGGAERLLGKGDLLFISSENPKSKRIQGAYISSIEIKKITDYIKNNNIQTKKEDFENDLSESLEKDLEDYDNGIIDSEEDPLYEEAVKLAYRTKKASASLLQRYLKIGYARAARLIDTMEERGVVGPQEGSKPRKVYFKDQEQKSSSMTLE